MTGRKIIGLLAILIFIFVYCLAIMLLAINILPDNRLIELLFYIVTGVLWIFPVMKIIRFMQPENAQDQDG